jgi:Rrf2 family transcriptional regulator, iron-sulfur cluster assembly transcription factor
MSIIFSRQCEYALRAVVYLAVRQPGELISIGEVATDLKIPVHFLAKIFQDLSKKQLLYSKKGPGGGFRLGVPAKEITLFHIVEAIDGVSFMENCIMGFPSCSVKNPCPMHAGWGSLRDSLYRMLANKSIERLAKEIQVKPEYRKFP